MKSGLSLNPAARKAQAGGGILAVVAAVGVVLVLVQGTLYYKAKGSARFLGSEKSKVLAQQLAEAGIEDNIADIGNRRLRVHEGLTDSVTYLAKGFGGGTYTTRLTTVAVGDNADTADLVSTGSVGRGAHTVQARLKLNKVTDTTLTPLVIVTPETTKTVQTTTVPQLTITMVVQDPDAMPDLNTTPAYAACMGSSDKKCDICHLPGGDISKANVINVNKSAIDTHIGHHGDYVTTDGTCDIYQPHPDTTITYNTLTDTLVEITDKTTYDTTVSVDTIVKVQILSWR